MQWTDKQLKVIETRNRNLLVSAAAGSGKTAVLVERILRLISEGDSPADIDRLLVMTFTNAAAAEMRERIGLAIEKKLTEQPDNEHLKAQAALVSHAQITTIDSFCLNLIRNHFNLLEIDPAFRIGDEGELTLLKADVMEKMLEEYYGNHDTVFERFADTYATGKSDGGIEDYIMQVYRFAQSNPFPEAWIDDCRKELEYMDSGDVMKTRWVRYMMDDMRMQLSEMEEQYEAAMDLCGRPGGPEGYLPVLQEERAMLERLAGAETCGELYERLQAVGFGRLPAARGKDIDPVKKEQVTECRNRVKKLVKDLVKSYGQVPWEEAVADILGTKDVVLKLLELAETFSQRYQEAKKDKNLVDFNDLEHYALKILAEQRDGHICFTPMADEIGEQYEEILVDEYQDSNYVQEVLIQSLSRERFGRPNVFMVGDVKQSIYRFRLARPELFMEKYDSYTLEDSPSQKIELHQNFRSRVQVLESVNRLFYQIMTRKLGNVEYTEEAALHPGAVFPEYPEPEAEVSPGRQPGDGGGPETEVSPGRQPDAGGEPEAEVSPGRQPEAASGSETEVSLGRQSGVGSEPVTELLLLDTGKESMESLDEEAADYTARELEAKLAALRIRRLTDPAAGQRIWDKEKGIYRTAGYGDIVILLRSVAGWSEVFVQVLTREGIPACAETGTGYFNTIEVETVLAMLAVIDNPMQDIPLAAVLKSPMVGMTEEELAWMTAAAKGSADNRQDRGLYGAFRYLTDSDEALSGRKDGENEEWNTSVFSAMEKLRRFEEVLARLRRQAAYLPIHQLIYQVYVQTGYYDYVSAMPAGETRRANLDMLLEKASDYEKTSYKGLFQFIRYINMLKKYDTDFGEASAGGRYDGMVRIMSIHKSKGLEFPIVILAGLGKKFNKQDVRGKLVIDADLGIGTDYLNLEERTRTGTLKKQVMKRKMDMDNLGEELRVLYVAMTRAKEKLIMTGADRFLEKKLEKWKYPFWQKGLPIPCTVLTGANSLLDWILMTGPDESSLYLVRQISADSLMGEETVRQVKKGISREVLASLVQGPVCDGELKKELDRRFAFQYPYRADIDLHTKMTVSELKKQGQQTDDFQGPYQPEVADYLRNREEYGFQDSEEESGETNLRQRQETKADGETNLRQRQETKADGETNLRRHQEAKAAGEKAARRGTAYHRVLELLDFTDAGQKKRVTEQMDLLLSEHKITRETRELVRPDVIWRAASSPLGRRIGEAQKKGVCRREQQFVMGIPAKDMGVGQSEELVLIQGIIDAYFQEAEGLVIVDYKTDRIGEGEEEVLANRYRTQLDYYQRALEQMTGIRVKERILYSLCLQKEIPV